ncbi:MAG: PadR family transcriptional regulator [Gemmatimonadota bacterium]
MAASDLLPGTLDAMILKAVSWGPVHGYGVARWIEEITDDALAIEEGSLYPALHRLEERGWIDAVWGLSENKRKARFYRITSRGRQQLKAELSNWQRLAAAMDKVLSATQPVPSGA